jgi:hypothetical protein
VRAVAASSTAYRGAAWGAERLVLCADGVVFDGDGIRVHSVAGQPSFALLPARGRAPAGTKVTEDGVFTRYTRLGEPVVAQTDVPVALLRAAGPAPRPVTGVQGRASAPADEHFDAVAAEYRVDVPDDLLAREGRTILSLDWTGDVARAYLGDVLVADQFFHGRPWDIALHRLPREALRAHGLRLKVLPLAADAPVHLPGRAPGEAVVAEIRGARARTVRTWTVGAA